MELKSQLVSPPTSMVSAFRRSAGERLSLRFWYSSSPSSTYTPFKTDTKNDQKNSNSNTPENISEETEEDAVSPTLAKRLYNSLLTSEWKIFGGQKQNVENEYKDASDFISNNAVATQTISELSSNKNIDKMENDSISAKPELETLPPDPCPQINLREV